MRLYTLHRLERLREYRREHPEVPPKRLSFVLGVSLWMVYRCLGGKDSRTIPRRKIQVKLQNSVLAVI